MVEQAQAQTFGDAVPEAQVQLAPVRGKARIEVLDILRGIAILAIFYMNIPFMAGPSWAVRGNPIEMGWNGADQAAYIFVQTFLSGTQRGMLELLFGAGLMVIAAKAMRPDGPVAVADLYIRRNLWLFLFGMIDVFILLWPGDILHNYALAALLLFPFRKLSIKPLIIVALLIPWVVDTTMEVIEEAGAHYQVSEALEDQGLTAPYTPAQTKAAKDKLEAEEKAKWEKARAEAKAEETEGRNSPSMMDFVRLNWSAWVDLVGHGMLIYTVIEAFSVMLLGIALWKLGVIQGGLSTRHYAILAAVCYGIGLTLRYWMTMERLGPPPPPDIPYPVWEYARIAVTVGHIAAINLAVKFATGRRLLSPFKAAGQIAFTLYFLEQIAGQFIMYSPIGMNLPMSPGWATLALHASIVIAILLVFANVWVRYVGAGPLEWLWRSLAYWQRQPFRRRDTAIEAPPPQGQLAPA